MPRCASDRREDLPAGAHTRGRSRDPRRGRRPGGESGPAARRRPPAVRSGENSWSMWLWTFPSDSSPMRWKVPPSLALDTSSCHTGPRKRSPDSRALLTSFAPCSKTPTRADRIVPNLRVSHVAVGGQPHGTPVRFQLEKDRRIGEKAIEVWRRCAVKGVPWISLGEPAIQTHPVHDHQQQRASIARIRARFGAGIGSSVLSSGYSIINVGMVLLTSCFSFPQAYPRPTLRAEHIRTGRVLAAGQR